MTTEQQQVLDLTRSIEDALPVLGLCPEDSDLGEGDRADDAPR